METPSFFGKNPVPSEGFVRTTDPDTSHEAAERIKPKEGTCLALVLDAIRQEPGSTCDQVCSDTGLRWNNVSRRITTLIRRKMVYADGKDKGQRKLWPVEDDQ